MSALGKLVVELALSTAQFTAGTKAAEQDALRMAKSVQDGLDRAGRASRDFLGSVVTGALAAVASYQTVAQVIGGVSRAIDRLDATAKASQKFGIPAADLEKLAYAAALSDVSIEQLGTSTRKLSEVLTKAAAGGTQEAAILKTLGIEAKNADGSVRGTADVLGDLADLFADMPDGTVKTALAVKLLGEAGAALVPMLNGGRKALKEVGDEAERFGLVSSDAARKAAEAFNDNLMRLGKITEGVFNRLAAQGLPTLQAVGEALIQVSDSFANAGDEASRLGSNQNATTFLQDVILASVTTAEALVGVVQAIRAVGKSVDVVATDIKTAWTIARSSPAEIGEAIRSGTGPLAEALAARNKTVADANAAYAALMGNGAALSQALRKQFEEINAGRGVEKAQTDALKKQADASDAARKAAERRGQAALAAANADDKAGKAAEQLAKATADFVGAVEHRLEVSAQELALGRKLNDEETALGDLRDRIAKGTISLSDAERLRVEGLIRQTQANREAARVAAEYLATLVAVANHGTKLLSAEATTTEQVRQQLITMRDRNAQLALGEASYSAMTAATMRSQAADLEWQAAMEGGNFQLEERARLLRAMAEEESRGSALKFEADATAAAKSVADEWDRTADGIRGALTDALRRGFESGESFGRNLAKTLENELKTRVAAAMANTIVNLGLSLVGASTGQGGGVGGVQIANTLASVYSAGAKAYGLFSGGAATGTTAQFVAGYQGSSALLGGAAGPVTNGAAGATGAGASSASAMTYAGWAALIAAGIYKANRDYSEGFDKSGAAQVGRDTGNFGGLLVGPGFGSPGKFESQFAGLLEKIGLSDRWASLLSGSTAVAKIFGRADYRFDEAGITGTLGKGGFAGEEYALYKAKGGLFRSDDLKGQYGAVQEDLNRYLNAGAKGVYDAAHEYAKALGLPVTALGEVSTQLKVEFGGDAAATQKALTEALAGYGDALVAGYAEAIKPLANYGETTIQTIERVAMSIAAVNDTLETLGVTALKSSIDGGLAASALTDLFGGIDQFAQATGAYYQQFFSDAERTDRLRAQLTESFAEYGAALPKSREAFRDLVEAQDLTTAAGRDAFHALITVSGAFNDLITAEEALGEATVAVTESLGGLTEKLLAGLDSVIGDFVGGQELAQYRGARIQQTLAGGGITASVDSIIGASREDIAELWRAVGEDGKAAILEAYGAWQVLQEGIDQSIIADFVGKLAASADDLMSAYAEINPAAETLVDTWRRTTGEMQALGDALAKFDGTQAVSAIDAFWQLVEKRDQLRGVVDGNADRAFNLQVGQGGQQAVNLLRQREADLWRQFASTSSPAIASAITDITLQRIQLEGSLHEQANRTQIDALKEQIAAAEKLRDTAAQMGQFVLSLQAGSLSNLGYQGRLSASEQIFSASLASGNDVQGSAQAYLQNAQGIYGGASAQYSAIFERVTAELSALGERVGSDPALANAQGQLDALLSISDTSAAQVEAIEVLNERFGEGIETLNGTVLEQVKQARELYAAAQATLKLQEAAITQAGQAYTQIINTTGRAAAAAEATLQRLEREWAKP